MARKNLRNKLAQPLHTPTRAAGVLESHRTCSRSHSGKLGTEPSVLCSGQHTLQKLVGLVLRQVIGKAGDGRLEGKIKTGLELFRWRERTTKSAELLADTQPDTMMQTSDPVEALGILSS